MISTATPATNGQQPNLRNMPSTSGVEENGIDPVPSNRRTASALEQFWIFAGANLAPINWVLGTVGIVLGLSLFETVMVIVVGNLLGSALFALFAVMGHKTGINAMVLSRLILGRRGARIVTVVMVLMPMGWVGVNTWVVLDLAMEALSRIGIEPTETARFIVAGVILAIQVAITAWGFKAINKFERWTMPVIFVVMIAMTIMAAISVEPGSSVSLLEGTEKWAVISTVMTGIGIGWGITWMVYAADYTRFAKEDISAKKIYTSTALSMFIPVVWLGILGAFIASSGSGATDPAGLVITAFGAMALPVLLLILHGPIATNIVVMYSSVLAVLSLDVKVAQWKIAIAGGIVSAVVLWGFLQSENFAQSVSEWMAALVFWISPWAAITLVDFYILRKQQVNVAQLYAPVSERLVEDINWRGVISLVVGLAVGWLFLMTTVVGLQGPIAIAFGGIDLSWLAGGIAGGVTYYLLYRRRNVDAM